MNRGSVNVLAIGVGGVYRVVMSWFPSSYCVVRCFDPSDCFSSSSRLGRCPFSCSPSTVLSSSGLCRYSFSWSPSTVLGLTIEWRRVT